MLVIINEGMLDEFNKSKSKIKPSQFYMIYHPEYKKQREWVMDYFDVLSVEKFISLLKQYEKKRGKTVQQGKNSIFLLFDIC